MENGETFFSEKISSNEDNIVLIEKDEITSEDNRISEIFNDFFHNAVASLNVDIDPGLLFNVNHIDDPVLKAIERYKNHPNYADDNTPSKDIESVNTRLESTQSYYFNGFGIML